MNNILLRDSAAQDPLVHSLVCMLVAGAKGENWSKAIQFPKRTWKKKISYGERYRRLPQHSSPRDKKNCLLLSPYYGLFFCLSLHCNYIDLFTYSTSFNHLRHV